MNYFSKKETSCQCGCGMDMQQDMKDVLNKVREGVGSPLYLSSGARCVQHNAAIGGARSSAHTKGLACDIKCVNSNLRYKIIKAALAAGVTRIEWGTPTWVHIDLMVPEAIFAP